MKITSPGAHIRALIEGTGELVESLPFSPVFRLDADTVLGKADLTCDPRLAFTEEGAELFKQAVDRGTFGLMKPAAMRATLERCVRQAHMVHQQEGLTIINHPWPGKPTWEHACDKCQFLGRSREQDLYYCTQGGYPTLIARFGPSLGQYKSGMALWPHDESLWAAAVLAYYQDLTSFSELDVPYTGGHLILIDGVMSPG